MHVRYAPTATAIVADFLDTTVESTVKELTIAVGQTIQIPVTIKRRPGVTQPVGLVVNRWFAVEFDKPELPAVTAYYDRLTERPAYRAHGRNGTP